MVEPDSYPKEIDQMCLEDKNCKQKLLNKYTRSLEIQKSVDLESKQIDRIAEACSKDEECKAKAEKTYLNMLKARTSKAVLESVDKGIGIAGTILKIAIYVLLFYLLLQVILFLLGLPSLITALSTALTNAINNLTLGIPHT